MLTAYLRHLLKLNICSQRNVTSDSLPDITLVFYRFDLLQEIFFNFARVFSDHANEINSDSCIAY